MTKTKTAFFSPTSVYLYDVERQSRVDYAEYMNPETKYEKVYYQVNVYSPEGKMLNFGFLDSIDDVSDVVSKVQEVVLWIESPDADVSSRFD